MLDIRALHKKLVCRIVGVTRIAAPPGSWHDGQPEDWQVLFVAVYIDSGVFFVDRPETFSEVHR